MSLEEEQDSPLTQDRLASRKNSCAMASLKEVNDNPKSIEEDFRSSAPALASSLTSEVRLG